MKLTEKAFKARHARLKSMFEKRDYNPAIELAVQYKDEAIAAARLFKVRKYNKGGGLYHLIAIKYHQILMSLHVAKSEESN